MPEGMKRNLFLYPRFCSKFFNNKVLCIIRILILINKNVFELLLVFVEYFREITQ